MGDGGLRIGELGRGVGVAVEGKDAVGPERQSGQRVVDILSRRVAVDLDGHPSSGGRVEHSVPVRRNPRTRAGDPASRMRQHMNLRVLDCGDEPAGLIVSFSELRMRSRQNYLEATSFHLVEIELPIGADVCLDSLQQAKPAGVVCIDTIDDTLLLGSFSHRHSAGDLEAVGVIGDRRVRVSPCHTGLCNLGEAGAAIAPF